VGEDTFSMECKLCRDCGRCGFGGTMVVFLIIMSIGRWSIHNVSGTRRARGASTTGLRPFLSTLVCRFRIPFSFVELR